MPAQETLGTPTYPCRMTHDKVRLHDKRAPMYNARRGAVAEFRHGLFKTKKTLFFGQCGKQVLQACKYVLTRAPSWLYLQQSS